MWDENSFILNSLYSNNTMMEYFELISTIRTMTGIWLRKLSENEFERVGVHPAKGEQSLRKILIYTTWHIEHHSVYLDRKVEDMNS